MYESGANELMDGGRAELPDGKEEDKKHGEIRGVNAFCGTVKSWSKIHCGVCAVFLQTQGTRYTNF
jgi:hypothetical protein